MLDALLEELQVHGVNRTTDRDAVLVTSDRDGVLPEGFYSTTNLATDIRIDGRWRSVDNPEMDCGIVVIRRARANPRDASCSCGRPHRGRVRWRTRARPSRSRDMRNFEFMNSDVSSEKPKALMIDQVAPAHPHGERSAAQGARGVRFLRWCTREARPTSPA